MSKAVQFADSVLDLEQLHTRLSAKRLSVLSWHFAEARVSIERFFYEIGYVPDLKNNHRLIVIDLDRRVPTLNMRPRVSAVGLLQGLKIDQQLLAQARDLHKSSLTLALKALSEQAGIHLGEATVELTKHLFRGAFKKLTSSVQSENR